MNHGKKCLNTTCPENDNSISGCMLHCCHVVDTCDGFSPGEFNGNLELSDSEKRKKIAYHIGEIEKLQNSLNRENKC